MPTLEHIGLNRYIYMSSSIDNMLLGSTDLAEVKNLDSASFVGEVIDDTRLLLGLNVYRNGPYGFSSWKQIRVSDNPLSRHLKKNNKFPILTRPKIIEVVSSNGQKQTFKERHGNQLVFDEPMIVSNHKPLIFRVGDNYLEEGRVEKRKFDIVSTFNNNSEYFTSDKINEILGLREDTDKNYNIIKKYYLGNALADKNTPLSSFETLFFSQGVYPPQQFTYKDYVRRRKNFNFYWNSDINVRHGTRHLHKPSYLTQPPEHTPYGMSNKYSGSYWPLDVDYRWESGLSGSKLIEQHGYSHSHVESQGNTIGSDPVFDKTNNQTSSYGVLWNTSTQFANHAERIGDLQVTSGGGAIRYRYASETFFRAFPLYSRRHTLIRGKSINNPAGGIGRRNRNIPLQYIPQGEAFWDVPRQSGKVPFFDTYEEFSNDISRFGKDHTLIPEFRISSHVPGMIKNGVSSFINDFLEIEGTTEEYNNSSKEEFFKIYSTSDFLKNFDIILEDHKDFVSPSTLTLRCKGVKKFLPYDGFYPVQRTVKLFHQFTSSYGENISTDLEQYRTNKSASYAPAKNSLYSTLFAPGVLYNSIKSGVACDYPVITQNFKVEPSGSGLAQIGVGNNYIANDDNDRYIVNDRFDSRIPFEAIVDPQEFLAGKKFIRNETHMSSSFLSSSCIWNGQGNDLYTKMSNNFISETVKFFLQGKNLTTIVSAKESSPNFGIANAGDVYGMRIKMFRSMTRPSVFLSSSTDIAYQAPQDILLSEEFGDEDEEVFPQETLTMYSRTSAFGPPSRGIHIVTGGEKAPEFFSRRGSTNGFIGSAFGRNFPFTPPYYHGQAWADIEFTPTESKKHTLAEILAKSTVKYTRFEHKDYYDTITSGSGPQSFYQDAINKNAMQLSSSMNLFIAGRLPKEIGLASTSINDQADSRWIIQTKFETPVLNFKKYADLDGDGFTTGIVKNKNAFGTDGVTLPNHPGSASVPIGMWHQYGDIPENDEGIFIQVTDIPNSWVEGVLGESTANRKSLIDITGFNTRPKKVGQIASRKVVSEAVVAIPFISDRGVKKFFRLDRNFVNSSIKDNPQDVPLTVYNQVQKMKKFIFPPQFDFVNFPEEVDPIAMYIFEFSMELSQQDLADIWQNIMPSQSLEFETSESSISHPLLEGELLNKESLRSNLRWMVFKVKQRAESSYQNVTFKKSSPDDNRGELKLQNVLRPEGEDDYIQYNWPYDFFSIVELAKIEAEVGFSNLKKDIQTGEFVAQPIEPGDDQIVNGIEDTITPSEKITLFTEEQLPESSETIEETSTPNAIMDRQTANAIGKATDAMITDAFLVGQQQMESLTPGAVGNPYGNTPLGGIYFNVMQGLGPAGSVGVPTFGMPGVVNNIAGSGPQLNNAVSNLGLQNNFNNMVSTQQFNFQFNN